MQELGWFGLFPFTWGGASLEESSYRALQVSLYASIYILIYIYIYSVIYDYTRSEQCHMCMLTAYMGAHTVLID
jgi:hypothetical protein